MAHKTIGLALSGGGARGFAHVGVLKVLAEHNIAVDVIVGTSAGSIIGGAFAAGMSAAEIETMANDVRWASVVAPSLSLSRKGVLSTSPMKRWLEKHLPVKRIEDTPIRFAATVFDLDQNAAALLTEGDLVTAIRASGAVPGIFEPIRDELGRRLVDGGVTSPLPVPETRALGADIVIAVDLLSCGASFRSGSRTGIGIMVQSTLALLHTLSKHQQSDADIVITPAIAHLRPDRISGRAELLALGEQAAREAMPDILAAIEK